MRVSQEVKRGGEKQQMRKRSERDVEMDDKGVEEKDWGDFIIRGKWQGRDKKIKYWKDTAAQRL